MGTGLSREHRAPARELVVIGGLLEQAGRPDAGLRRVNLTQQHFIEAGAGTRQPGQPAVVGRRLRMHQPGRQRRGARRDAIATLDQFDRPAPPRQRVTDAAAGQAGTDDDRAPLTRIGRRRLVPPHHVARRVAAFQAFALAPETRPQRQVEAGRSQRLAHRARSAPGGQRRTGTGQPRNRAQQWRRPHGRIARGRKAIEKDRIGAERQLRHHGIGRPQRQCQRDRAVVERQTVQSGNRYRPAIGKLRSQMGQRWWCGSAQAVGRHRVCLDRHKVQPLRPLRIVAPRLPGGEKVGAQAKAGLQHDKLVAALPVLRQAAAADEHLHCLRQRAIAARVDIAITLGERHAIAPGQRLRHGRQRGRRGRGHAIGACDPPRARWI